MTQPCNPTLQRVAQELFRDPLADRIQPGTCRICGRELETDFTEVRTAMGALRIPNAACDRAKELYDDAAELADLMRIEASRWKARKAQSNAAGQAAEAERKRRAAQHALGLDEDLSDPVSDTVTTGEF